MSLILSEDETMLADSVRGLLARSAPIEAFRALRDSGASLRYDPALFAQFAENGFVAPHVAEEDGGLGLGSSALGVIAQEAGRRLAAAPLLGAALSATLITRAGDRDQRAQWLGEIVAGTQLVAAALEETPRHDPDHVQCEAEKSGEGWALTGTKTRVVDGFGADAWIVSAREGGELALFRVDDGDGVTTEAMRLLDSRNYAHITFTKASAEKLVGGNAVGAIGEAFDLGRAVLAAELLGMADEAFERTIAYLKERVQFGRKIGTYQALQHRAARLYGRLELARGPVLKALRAIDAKASDASQLASLSKAVMTQLARETLVEATQMHGGIGVTDEFDMGLFFKRVRAAGDLFGDDYFHTERLASERWAL